MEALVKAAGHQIIHYPRNYKRYADQAGPWFPLREQADNWLRWLLPRYPDASVQSQADANGGLK
jgi:hypothetical protein